MWAKPDTESSFLIRHVSQVFDQMFDQTFDQASEQKIHCTCLLGRGNTVYSPTGTKKHDEQFYWGQGKNKTKKMKQKQAHKLEMSSLYAFSF